MSIIFIIMHLKIDGLSVYKPKSELPFRVKIKAIIHLSIPISQIEKGITAASHSICGKILAVRHKS